MLQVWIGGIPVVLCMTAMLATPTPGGILTGVDEFLYGVKKPARGRATGETSAAGTSRADRVRFSPRHRHRRR